MKIYELEQDRAIRRFIRKNKDSKEELSNFFRDHFLSPFVEVEYTNKVANNIINITHSYYLSLSKQKKFHFLKVLGKLFDVALLIKIWEPILSGDGSEKFWRDQPTFFLRLNRLTEHLEVMRHQISLVDKRHVHSKIILVEGESEYNFLNAMQEKTIIANLDFPIYNYKGKNNVQNLVHYIKEKNRQGIKVLLTYDTDGQTDNFLERLKKNKCKIEDTFGFVRDFESSFPPKFFKFALENYIKRYCSSELRLNIADIRRLLKKPPPVVVSFKQEYGINISKAKLGLILGRIMINVIERHWNDIFYRKKKSYEAEIYKFLDFVIRE